MERLEVEGRRSERRPRPMAGGPGRPTFLVLCYPAQTAWVLCLFQPLHSPVSISVLCYIGFTHPPDRLARVGSLEAVSVPCAPASSQAGWRSLAAAADGLAGLR